MSETAWLFAAVAFYSPAAIFTFLSIIVALLKMATEKDVKPMAALIVYLLSVIFGTSCLVQWAKVQQGEKIQIVSIGEQK